MQAHLVVRRKETKGPSWVEFLDGLDETETSEGQVGIVGRLDLDRRPGVISLNNDHAGRVLSLVSDSDGL